MLTATAIAIFFVPMFFVMVRRIFKSRHAPDSHPSPSSAPAHGAAE
jgi:hypothetical protein